MTKSGTFSRGLTVLLLVLVSCRPGHRATMREPAAPQPILALLATGAPIHGANGLAFGSSGELYVASLLGDEILTLDPETGDLTSMVGANQGVVGPDDVAIGPDGSLYWTSTSRGEVARLKPDGTVRTQLLSPGVNGLTFSDDHRLFASITFMGDALYELDPELDDSPRLVAANLGFLDGIDWGPDGLLYGPLSGTGEIVRIDVDTGEVETVAQGFETPVAVKFDAAGRLYAVDRANGQVCRIDPEHGTKVVLATLTPGIDNLACDAAGRLFVSHAQDGCICEVLPDGSRRDVWTGGMVAPGGTAVLPRTDGESVFVADLWSLREFDGKTGELRSVHRHMPGTRRGIAAPFTVAADGDNLIITSYIVEDVVQVYDPGMQEVLLDIRDLKSPLSAVRFQGDLVVAEHGTQSVVRVSGDSPDERTVLARGLGVPTGLAATDDDLWVCDLATGLVLQLVADGKPLGEPRIVAQGFSYPEGIAIAHDGTLLVREGQTGCLKRVDPATGKVTLVASSLTPCLQGEHPTWVFNGVAVGPSGAIYITCDAANALYRIEPQAK